jgi:hypothetical protein
VYDVVVGARQLQVEGGVVADADRKQLVREHDLARYAVARLEFEPHR